MVTHVKLVSEYQKVGAIMSKHKNVTRVLDKSTKQYFLQGRETATKKSANVFGNSDCMPLQSARNKQLYYEAEVEYCGTTIADDNPEDYGESYQFKLSLWHNLEAGPDQEIFIEEQDFVAGHEHQDYLNLTRMLRVAVDRIRTTRNGEPFEPLIVGESPRLTAKVPKLAPSCATKAEEWINDLNKRRQTRSLERQLKRQKEALAREVIKGLGLKAKTSVGVSTLNDAKLALTDYGKSNKWSELKLNRALQDLQQGFGYYRQTLRKKRDSM